MAFQLGRVGRTLTLLEPEVWDESGGQITVRGRAIVSPNTDGARLRDQFLGYQENGDEPIVPVIFDSEPRLTGYYRVLDVSAQTLSATLTQGYVTYGLTLKRVQGFTQPLLESVITGALLPNAVGAVLGDVHAFHAVPAAASEYSYGSVSSVFSTRTSADGNLIFLDAGSVLSAIARFGLSPANFYVGAATFKQGNPLQPVVGLILTQADLVNWELSNGLVKVTPNASAGKLDVSHFNGSAWSAVKTYAISATYAPTAVADRDVETITTTGTPLNASSQYALMATFKPATSIALVGSVGAFATGSGVTVSPAFGQATVAGHLLVAWINSGSTPTTAAAGWVSSGASNARGAIWYKPNCGAGEAAPTFTCAGGSGNMNAQLAEFSGALTVSPVDQVGIVSGGSASPITVNTGAADVGADLILTIARWAITTAATATFTQVYNNATAVNAGNSGAQTVDRHANFSYGIIGAAVPVTITGINSLVVTRNSVEEATIRLSLATSVGATAGIVTLDIGLRRGARLARLYLVSSSLSLTFKLARNSTEAATAITYGAVTLGGIRATADDGDGNRYVILSYQRATPASDLVNGAITQGAAGLMADYAIGSEVGGSTATAGLDDAASIAKQYLAFQGESQRIVQR